MTRYAVISVGTNSCRLLIARRDFDVFRISYHESRGTRLGQGVDESRRLNDAAMQKTLAVITDYTALAKGCERIFGIGTSALRDAANSGEFSQAFERIVGAPLAIVPGEEEARCSFAGVINGLRAAGRDVPDAMSVIDVGGGSTEFATRGRADAEPEVVSLQIGAVRLTEKYLTGDPPSELEIERCRQAIRAQLTSLPATARPSGMVVAVGGTATTAARMLQLAGDSTGANVADVPMDDLRSLLKATLSMTLGQRRRMRGLPEQRADIFPAGLMIVVEAAESANAQWLIVSESDLLVGYLARKVG
jgi:exopolyphosphatase / guanosine-5'-triphosphate,3'-diphosphate pyrophosphatase